MHNDDLKKVGLVYGTCSTAAATVSKVVAASNFTLAVGARVAVIFTNAVPTNATLNVNSTGAKNIRWQQVNIFAGVINAGDTAEFVYSKPSGTLSAGTPGASRYCLCIRRALVTASTYRPEGIRWYGSRSLELYEQGNGRIPRQGQAKPVVVHHLIAAGTIDEDVMSTLASKATVQTTLLSAVKARVSEARTA